MTQDTQHPPSGLLEPEARVYGLLASADVDDLLVADVSVLMAALEELGHRRQGRDPDGRPLKAVERVDGLLKGELATTAPRADVIANLARAMVDLANLEPRLATAPPPDPRDAVVEAGDAVLRAVRGAGITLEHLVGRFDALRRPLERLELALEGVGR